MGRQASESGLARPGRQFEREHGVVTAVAIAAADAQSAIEAGRPVARERQPEPHAARAPRVGVAA